MSTPHDPKKFRPNVGLALFHRERPGVSRQARQRPKARTNGKCRKAASIAARSRLEAAYRELEEESWR
jgi:8-oxo-dGTP pyrophosphatase MutT (NUDIX family)